MAIDFVDWFIYNNVYGVLICVPCGSIVQPGNGGGVHGHLNYSHNTNSKKFPLTTQERIELIRSHEQHELNPAPLHPTPGAPPLPHLPVVRALQCVDCEYVCCTSSSMEVHARKIHKWLKASGLTHGQCAFILIDRATEMEGMLCSNLYHHGPPSQVLPSHASHPSQ
jgi:Orsellinic acid/F9775 biosynthesis cluster protein D